MSTIRLKDSTMELLTRFADSDSGAARVYAAAVLDVLRMQEGEDANITMALRRAEFADLIEGDGARAQLLNLLLDILEDIGGESCSLS